MKIHPTAIVGAECELAEDVEIGPYAVLEGRIRLGPRVRVGPHAWMTGEVTVGADTAIHKGAVIGHEPQDKAFRPETRSAVRIGERSIIREHATIHRPTKDGQVTSIGNDCFLMAGSHVAHDCRIEDEVILCNNALLAGYVQVGRRAFVSGNTVVHQFSRIGTLCMIGGGAGVGQDVPPYTTVAGRSQIRSLNVVGMRRAGIGPEARRAVKEAYRRLFGLRHDLALATASLSEAPDLPEIAVIRAFYAAGTRRGFVWPPRGRFDVDDERQREADE